MHPYVEVDLLQSIEFRCEIGCFRTSYIVCNSPALAGNDAASSSALARLMEDKFNFRPAPPSLATEDPASSGPAPLVDASIRLTHPPTSPWASRRPQPPWAVGHFPHNMSLLELVPM
jgi:hypothetical protein